jgi:hypothetical protein
MAEATGEWRGVVDVAYGTVILIDAASYPFALEPPEVSRMFEEHCASVGAGVQVQLPERDQPVETHIRTLDTLEVLEAGWDQVTEVGFQPTSGRMLLYSWMPDEDLATEITLPVDPLVARIHWGGLETWLQGLGEPVVTVGPGLVRLRIDIAPGRREGVRTLREWHAWAPPVHESIRADGLRLFRGLGAERRREGMEPLPIRFWHPYPTIDEGQVTSMWRDPSDGTRWANGTGGTWSHRFLRELSTAEADALETEGFPQIYTYARDAEGRIWAADQIPLARAVALLLIPADRWAMLTTIMPADQMLVVDLPDGWSRITRRPLDDARQAVLVDEPIGDGHDALYQRWRDGAEIVN